MSCLVALFMDRVGRSLGYVHAHPEKNALSYHITGCMRAPQCSAPKASSALLVLVALQCAIPSTVALTGQIGVPALHCPIHSLHRHICDNVIAQLKAVTFILDVSHQLEMVGFKH